MVDKPLNQLYESSAELNLDPLRAVNSLCKRASRKLI